MFRTLTLLLLTLVILSSSTCEEEVDLSLQSPPPKLVINSTFSPDQTFEVIVSRTQGLFDEINYQNITNAKVDIYEEGQFFERLTYIQDLSPSYYLGNKSIRSDKRYTLKVETPSLDPIEATDLIPRKANLAGVQVIGVREKILQSIDPEANDREYTFTVRTTIEDPVNQENYYELNLFVEPISYEISAVMDTSRITLPPFGPIFLEEPTDNSPAVPFLNGGVLIKDRSFDGQTQSFSFALSYQLNSKEQLLGNIIVELRAVSRAYYLYHNSLDRHIQAQENPLSEPVIVFNNIEGGYGIFSGFTSTYSSSIPIQE
ncbi:MAG: DUF4249 domain-containing protein [Saprospiraceae bacterium]